MRDNNKQLTKQVLGLMGDTMMALIIGMLGLMALGGIVGVIWNLIA